MRWLSLPGVVLQRVLVFPARRPRATLVLAAALVVLSAVSVSRIRPDASLEAMFSRDDRSAAALVRVLNHFSAAEELIVLATVPGEGPAEPDGASAARLLEFAGRFERAVAGSPEASAMANGVAYRADPQMRQFIEKVLVPGGLFYLDEPSFEAARQRLTKEEMRRQVEQNAAAIAQPGPAASAMAKVLLQDPLRLHEFLMDRMTAGRGSFKTFGGGDAFVSGDGRAVLIRVPGKRPPSDLPFSRRFTETIRSIAAAANTDGLDLAYSGSYAIAATSERSIRGDMIASINSSVVGLLVLFIVANRRPLRAFSLAFLPVALGVLLGFGTYAAFSPTLTPLSGAVGAILAGMGIDYSILYLSHYQGRRREGDAAAPAVEATAVQLGPALFGAWVTSVIGFLAIGWSRVGALRDFALLGGLGLAGTFVATVIILPALLALLDRKSAQSATGKRRTGGPRVSFEGLPRWVGRRARWVLAASACVLLAALGVIASGGGELLPLESDLTVMHPRPNAALDTQAEIARRFGSSPDSLIVHLEANSAEQLVGLAHRVRERLSADAARSGGISGVFGLDTLLPDPAVAARRLAAVASGEAARVAADFRSVIADSPFDSRAYEPYAGFLNEILSRRAAPAMADLVAYPQLARMVLPNATLASPAAGPAEAITLVFVSGAAEDRASRDAAMDAARAALADLPGATLTGMSVLSHDTEASVRRELPRLFGLAVVVVTAYLLLHFRSARDAALAVLPAAFSFVCLLALARLAGQRLNMMNLVALPLLIGMDVDYGIFLVSLARAARAAGPDPSAVRRKLVAELGTGCHAIVMCAASTVLGFGSLVTTSVPAVRSLGFAVGVGILGCLYATLFVLAPLLLLRGGDRDRIKDRDEEEAGGARVPAGGTA